MNTRVGTVFLATGFGFVLAATASAVASPADRLENRLPFKEDSIRFAVIGDSGTGGAAQYEVGELMARYHELFPFDFVLMLGDNLYGEESAQDYREKFECPYRALLERGVRFYASLGNHDQVSQINYPHFNMRGRRFYSFRRGNVEFFALDSVRMDVGQLQWLHTALSQSRATWKIGFFHHPLYSSAARPGSQRKLRGKLEPIFIRYGLDLVFSGHDHVYERIKPQRGVYYFVSGGAGRLRRGNIEPSSSLTAAGFDLERHFLLVEIAGDALHFQAISRSARVVDSGTLRQHPFRPATLLQVD